MRQRLRGGSVVLLLLVLLPGCGAATARHVSTVTMVSAHATLGALQDTEILLVCGRPAAPTVPACVPEPTHRDLSARLAQAFEYDASLARALRDWTPGTPPPDTVGQLLSQIQQVIRFVLDHLPASTAKTKLLVQLGGS